MEFSSDACARVKEKGPAAPAPSAPVPAAVPIEAERPIRARAEPGAPGPGISAAARKQFRHLGAPRSLAAGAGRASRHRPGAAPGRTGASPPVAVSPGGDVTFNFADADIREVVRAVVGDILGLNYYVDAKVQGTVTVETTRPLPRAAVLPALERILRANGAALVEDNGLVRITPLDTADKGARAQAPTPAIAIRLLPLQYVPADQIQKIIEPFVPPAPADGRHHAQCPRAVGHARGHGSLVNLVRTFDTDWLSRMSFALVPLRSGTAESIANQMSEIVSGAAGGARATTGAYASAGGAVSTRCSSSRRSRDISTGRAEQIARSIAGAAEVSSARTSITCNWACERPDRRVDTVFGPAGAAAAKPAPSSSSYLEPASSMSPLCLSGFGTAGGTASARRPRPGSARCRRSPLAQAAPARTSSASSTTSTGSAVAPARDLEPTTGRAHAALPARARAGKAPTRSRARARSASSPTRATTPSSSSRRRASTAASRRR